MTTKPSSYASLALWNLAKVIKMKKSFGFIIFRIMQSQKHLNGKLRVNILNNSKEI